MPLTDDEIAKAVDEQLERNKAKGTTNVYRPSVLNSRKSRASQSLLTTVTSEKLHKKLLTVLARDIDHLLDVSFVKQLSKDESTALASYLRLTHELVKIEGKAGENKTDAELEAIAAKAENSAG